jgi:sulfatase maturation enzyme AslB (radical SAM superfamily)
MSKQKNIHCPMIHNGLTISIDNNEPNVIIQSCCLRKDEYIITSKLNIWNDSRLIPLREKNNKNEWDTGCWTCQGNEAAGITSFRTGMLEKFGVKKNLSGPSRLDLMFDISCNLACRSCGPQSSTFWQKHLKDNNLTFTTTSPISKANKMIAILKTLDLSNLEMVVFCGGETLMGDGYWRVAEAIADMVPHAKEKLIISFQTNGTQSIKEKYFDIIEKLHLVKLNISLDGIEKRFEYLRWPANWQQVTANIINLQETLPVNVMFLIEETMSIFNLYYQSELEQWAKNNFSANRLGDVTNHTRHRAERMFRLDNLTQKYIDNLSVESKNLISPTWAENPIEIKKMIEEIQLFDKIRNEDWTKTFPEVAEFYSNYLR